MRPAVVRSYPTRRITNPVIKSSLKIWEAMCATAAGLRYTNPDDPAAEPSGLLVDGSIKKSNPIKDVFFECRSLYHINDPMLIVSIGTGAAPYLDPTTRSEFRDMAENVHASERNANGASAKFEWDERDILGSEWLKYFRFNDPGLAACGLEEVVERERIESMTRRYLEEIVGEMAGQRFLECVEAIARVVMGERVPEGLGNGCSGGVGTGMGGGGGQGGGGMTSPRTPTGSVGGFGDLHPVAQARLKRKRNAG